MTTAYIYVLWVVLQSGTTMTEVGWYPTLQECNNVKTTSALRQNMYCIKTDNNASQWKHRFKSR